MTRPKHYRARQPKTVYDVRRYVTLVQVLSLNKGRNALRQLCEGWGLEPIMSPLPDGSTYLDEAQTIALLAQHVIDYHHDEEHPDERAGA
jgi:hypothetical protein